MTKWNERVRVPLGAFSVELPAVLVKPNELTAVVTATESVPEEVARNIVKSVEPLR
jgi:hypothetical protein